MKLLSFLITLLPATLSAATWTSTWTPTTVIPDNDDVGFTDSRAVSVPGQVKVDSVTVNLNFTGGWNGDLYAYLVHGTGFTVLLNRPGRDASTRDGSASAGLNITLDESATPDIHTAIPMSGGTVIGTFKPDGRTTDPLAVVSTDPRTALFASFAGLDLNGGWKLFVADQSPGAISTLQSWSLNATVTSSVYWTGAESSNWNTSTTNNWKQSVDNTATPFLSNAVVYFNDSPTRSTVDISGSDVSPAATHFTNTTATSYTLQGTNGIATGLVTKTGNGTVTIANTNSYPGATTVSGGALIVNGSIAASSLTTVETGGTLGGTGTTGTVKVTSGGTLAPTAQASGDGLTVSGNLNFESGSIFEWDLNAGSSDPGAGLSNQGSYGQVASTSVTLPAAGSVVFKIVLGGNSFTDEFWNTHKQWSNLFTVGGSAYSLESLFSATNFSGAVAANGVVANQGYFTFSGSTLHWAAVPEPSGALAGLLISAALFRRRRAVLGGLRQIE